MADAWTIINMKTEVSYVRRCLGSVVRMCEDGSIVPFEMHNNYIHHVKSGNRHTMMNNGKGCVVDVWVPMPGYLTTPSFSGQGQP